MPIYAYRCASCGYAQDVLRKISDPPLTVCPACGAASYSKQITAAGFQLKGSGWYATDFKDKASVKPATDRDGATPEKPAPEAAPAADGSSAAPAPAPAPAAPKTAAPPTNASSSERSA